MDAPVLPAPIAGMTRPPFPYPGLRPFEPEEWQIFFGRETMIDEVIARLAQQHLVMIHGASGSGKSSLVRAGVLPKLARQHLRHGMPWLTCAMRPSGGPLWSLATELARLEGHAEDLSRISDIMRLFNRRGATLAGVIDSLDALAGKRMCILVDQFEELFRYERETSREEAELFVDLLIGALPPAPESDAETPGPAAGNLHVVLTMRSEFLGECARFDGFAEVVNRTQYLVPPLTQPALMRAIQLPARLYGGEVTTELAQRLVADVRGKQDELPLIQHGLMLFWHDAVQSKPSETIVLGSSVLPGGASLAQLLSDHADRVMQEVAPTAADRLDVERVFRALTDINAEGQAIRRPQAFAQLATTCGIAPERLRRIIDAFRAEGVSFLTPYFPAAITERTVIDISHEALIRYWRAIADPQLGWLRREFDDGLRWRSLLFEAKEFATDRKRLLSAATTAERQRWLADRSQVWSERYGGQWPLVVRFVNASAKAVVRARRIRRLWLFPAIAMAAIAPPMMINDGLFDAFKADSDMFVGMVVIAIGGGLLANLIAMGVDYSRSLVGHISTRLRRGAADVAAVPAGIRAARLRRPWPDRWRVTWGRMKTAAYVLLLAGYVAGLGWVFRGAIMDPPKFAVDVGDAAYRDRHYAGALRWYRKAAEYGNQEAQYDLGYLYANGQGTKQDYPRAMAWYRKAADRGRPNAQSAVADLYANGQGVPQDFVLAMTWYRKAADQGDAYAENQVGWLYDTGKGVPRNDAEAIVWFRRSADHGNAVACRNTGTLYEEGSGVVRDYQAAMKWFRKGADGGDPVSFNNIGYLYENGLGVKRDYAQAMSWYRKAADKGTAAAKYHIARLYESGLGVPKDDDRAFDWMINAAEAGEARAKDWLNARRSGR